MKKSTNLITIGLILIFLCSMLNDGCADPSSKVIGKWIVYMIETNGKQEMQNSPKRRPIEFFSDKTMSLEGIIGNWTILNDGRIKITFADHIMFANFEGNNLILTVQGEKDRMFFKRMDR